MTNEDILETITKARIICSAIHIDDHKKHVHTPKNIKTGFVIAGRRHHNCFTTFNDLNYVRNKTHSIVQGFLTDNDMFLNRKEASSVAFDRGQTQDKCSVLMSEDLY